MNACLAVSGSPKSRPMSSRDMISSGKSTCNVVHLQVQVSSKRSNETSTFLKDLESALPDIATNRHGLTAISSKIMDKVNDHDLLADHHLPRQRLPHVNNAMKERFNAARRNALLMGAMGLAALEDSSRGSRTLSAPPAKYPPGGDHDEEEQEEEEGTQSQQKPEEGAKGMVPGPIASRRSQMRLSSAGSRSIISEGGYSCKSTRSNRMRLEAGRLRRDASMRARVSRDGSRRSFLHTPKNLFRTTRQGGSDKKLVPQLSRIRRALNEFGKANDWVSKLLLKHFMASVIQAWWRGHAVRRRWKEDPVAVVTATKQTLGLELLPEEAPSPPDIIGLKYMRTCCAGGQHIQGLLSRPPPPGDKLERHATFSQEVTCLQEGKQAPALVGTADQQLVVGAPGVSNTFPNPSQLSTNVRTMTLSSSPSRGPTGSTAADVVQRVVQMWTRTSPTGTLNWGAATGTSVDCSPPADEDSESGWSDMELERLEGVKFRATTPPWQKLDESLHRGMKQQAQALGLYGSLDVLWDPSNNQRRLQEVRHRRSKPPPRRSRAMAPTDRRMKSSPPSREKATSSEAPLATQEPQGPDGPATSTLPLLSKDFVSGLLMERYMEKYCRMGVPEKAPGVKHWKKRKAVAQAMMGEGEEPSNT